ncbi:DsrE family protein [Paenarthrobacter sp. DKR-5]|uniref:DsrE family protein n=1 Tax=Paenarthrobacter sp. DKR-5 TaxID=2835535 RepID=UPI001BDBBB20|nr:DsrE family protein [Paenarthrobacter sp. DKR-5]MBT1004390.1 DsrE family protein [Paenarthrobacter sp. DKR-5]
MTSTIPAKVAFLILTDSPDRGIPGLVMASRLKMNRGADVRVLFFGPGVKLAGSGAADQQLADLIDSGVKPTACSGQVEQFGLAEEFASRPIELLAAGAEVEAYAREGFTVLSF